jgi:predicted anti-sigma-YlaC factor YlaD
MSHDPYAELDAAYLLDALAPDERADFEAHLAGCADCRARVSELGPLLPLLAAADDGDLDEMEGTPLPETLLPALLAAARRSRTRRRTLLATLAGVAAASVVAVALTLTSPWSGGPAPGQSMVALRPGPVSAAAALQSTDWGTEITLTCWYREGAVVPAGYRYGLAVRGTDGTTYQLGTWQLSPGQQIRFTAGTALDVSQIRAVDITDSSGTSLLELAR